MRRGSFTQSPYLQVALIQGSTWDKITHHLNVNLVADHYAGMFTKSKAGGKLSKYRLATILAILLHAVGLVGLLAINERLFLPATPLNLLGMFLLLLWTQVDRNRRFVIFLATCFLVGMGIEIMGVRTGVFFGCYSYGSLLGPKLLGYSPHTWNKLV